MPAELITDVSLDTVFAGACEPDEAGVFACVAGGSELYTTGAGNRRFRFMATITEGPHKGCTISSGLNIDPWDKVKGFLGAWLISTGVPQGKFKTALKKGLGTHLIDGKKCYCRFKPRDPEVNRKYSEVNWVPKSVYDGWKSNQAERDAAAASAAPELTPNDFMANL